MDPYDREEARLTAQRVQAGMVKVGDVEQLAAAVLALDEDLVDAHRELDQLAVMVDGLHEEEDDDEGADEEAAG